MAIHLTPEQRDDLRQHGDGPVPVVDPETNAVYFLVADGLFRRFQAWLAVAPFDVRQTYPAQGAALSHVWDDPALDDYNDADDPLQP